MTGADPGRPPRPEPTGPKLAEWSAALRGEIREELSSDRWAILDAGSDQQIHRVYEAAALRHCVAFLEEIEVAAAGQELASRVVARTHIATRCGCTSPPRH